MNKKIISTNNSPKPIGAYSQGVITKDIIFLSGQIGMNKNLELALGFEKQVNQCWINIEELILSAGFTKENISKLTIFLTDLDNFNMLNQSMENFFSESYPARSVVQVSKLPKNALVEIEAILSRS